jgi:hypothetical protein
VLAAIAFGRQTGLPVAGRGGGHGFPGLSNCDDGLVIDVSGMKAIRVDPDGQTVRAQAGVLLGELDRETQAFGLAAPAGIVTTTGLAGLTLGGGLMRKFGLTMSASRWSTSSSSYPKNWGYSGEKSNGKTLYKGEKPPRFAGASGCAWRDSNPRPTA